jgi:hypothetical protein
VRPYIRMKFFAISIGCLLCIAGYALGQDVQVTASVGSDSVGVQDQFQFTVTVSGKDSGDSETPRLPSMRGFKIVSGPSVSSQFQWINGQTSSNKSFIYVLIPEKEGQFTIDPVEIRVGGRIYKSQPVQVRVTSAPRNSQPQRRPSVNPLDPFEPLDDNENLRGAKTAPESVFVKAEPDRTAAYQGQQLTLSYRVYTQVSISGFQLQESPPLSGFWVEDLEVEKQPRPVRQMVNGREYLAFTVKKQALFANTVGTLKIPSSIFAIAVEPRGGLFGAFGRSETLYRRTQEISLDIKPLPAAGRPSGFNNAVGSFTLSSNADKTKAATGEAIAFHVKLEGQGNLKMIPDIALPNSPDFTVYSSKREDSIRPSAGNQISGSKNWEYVIVPKAPGRQTIPSLSFSFFDAEKEKYETVATSPIALEVARGSESAGLPALSGSGKQDLVRRGIDINFIKLSAEDFRDGEVPPFHAWFWFIAGIPLALNFGIIVYQWQHTKASGDEGSVRSRKARRRALERLDVAEKQGRNEARKFYDGAAEALSGYLSDRFRFAGIELTGDNLERDLSRNSVQQETIEATKACLQECDFGRFVSASPDTMRELSARIRETIENLEKAGLQRAQSGGPR